MKPYRLFLLAATLLVLIFGQFFPAYAVPAFQSPITQPDLTVADISWSPEIIHTGDSVTFTICIRNLGKISTAEWGPFDLQVDIDGAQIATLSVPVLAPGVTDCGYTVDWTATNPGMHTVSAIVDASDIVPEADETNNTLSEPFEVLSADPLEAPDLVISSLTWTPTLILLGHTVNFTVCVRNQGIMPAAGTVAVAYTVNGSSAGEGSVTDLQPDAEDCSLTFSWTTTSATPHTVLVEADPDGLLEEADETNNTAEDTFEVDYACWVPMPWLMEYYHWYPLIVASTPDDN